MPRTTLVTGVSRQHGIGFAIAQRLLRDEGARVFAHSYAAYDATQPWGVDPGGITAVLTALGGESDRLAHAEADLADPSAPQRLVSQAVERLGTLDALVVNHARSQLGTIAQLDAKSLDLTWAINVRAALLLVQAFANQYRAHPDGGRIVLFTSGQHRGPAPAEIPYAATKGALHQITATLADALAEHDITVNCINPGPTNTGWATPKQHSFVTRHMPRGRWNTAAEAASVVALLLSPDAATITGQVIDAEGGFRRFTPCSNQRLAELAATCTPPPISARRLAESALNENGSESGPLRMCAARATPVAHGHRNPGRETRQGGSSLSPWALDNLPISGETTSGRAPPSLLGPRCRAPLAGRR